MEATASSVRPLWHPQLRDPSGRRGAKPRRFGLTMVIDKGLGPHAFEDLLATAGDHVDIVKFAFGTSPLYPDELLRTKIALARRRGVTVMPGGTLLEAAVRQDMVPSFFRAALELGFDAVEVSDGTIELPRPMRTELISMARGLGFRVFTEFGKKKRDRASTWKSCCAWRNRTARRERTSSSWKRGNRGPSACLTKAAPCGRATWSESAKPSATTGGFCGKRRARNSRWLCCTRSGRR